jgi:hypothetical protein
MDTCMVPLSPKLAQARNGGTADIEIIRRRGSFIVLFRMGVPKWDRVENSISLKGDIGAGLLSRVPKCRRRAEILAWQIWQKSGLRSSSIDYERVIAAAPAESLAL